MLLARAGTLHLLTSQLRHSDVQAQHMVVYFITTIDCPPSAAVMGTHCPDPCSDHSPSTHRVHSQDQRVALQATCARLCACDLCPCNDCTQLHFPCTDTTTPARACTSSCAPPPRAQCLTFPSQHFPHTTSQGHAGFRRKSSTCHTRHEPACRGTGL